MSIEIIILSMLFLVGTALSLFLINKNTPAKKSSLTEGIDDQIHRMKNCPLCGEILLNGMRVHSTVYKGKNFDFMQIYGCPRCRDTVSANPRRCPCCKENLPSESYLVAKAVQRPEQRPHVSVYGCSICQPGMGGLSSDEP